MKLISKLALIGASLMGSAAYAGCNTGDSSPVECDWTVAMGTVSGNPVQACLPAKANIGIPSPVCWPIAPAVGAFSELFYYSSATGGKSYNNYITFNGTLQSAIPAPPQGITPAQIAADFPAYIIWQFETGGTGMDATVKSMTDMELLLLAQFFIANNGNQTLMAQLAASDLSATNLVRWQASFTQAMLSPAVALYTTPGTSSAYFAHPGLKAAVNTPPSPPYVPDPFASYDKPIDMIYLEFRTNPATGCSVMCALTKTAKLLSGELYLAWAVGTAIGTTFYNAMYAIDPSYGWDLMTQGGGVLEGNGLVPPYQSDPGSSPSGHGFVQDSDGTWYDPDGNVVPDPNQTSYGIPADPSYYPPYTIFDPSGDCLLLLDCLT
jgi:hypothetical protein